MNDHPVRIVGEATSLGTVIASLAGWLPGTATLLAIVWYGVLLYDRFRPRTKDRSDDGTNY